MGAYRPLSKTDLGGDKAVSLDENIPWPRYTTRITILKENTSMPDDDFELRCAAVIQKLFQTKICYPYIVACVCNRARYCNF